jgi:hypothetical protein
LTDEFPKAFKRFPPEKKEVKTFEELKQNFKEWGGDRAPMTNKQNRALGKEAIKLGILPHEQFRFKRYDKVQIRWRDVTTGRLVKHIEEG